MEQQLESVIIDLQNTVADYDKVSFYYSDRGDFVNARYYGCLALLTLIQIDKAVENSITDVIFYSEIIDQLIKKAA